MKTNIKLRVTPEQSEAVQKICFANGINWYVKENKISYTAAEYLFIEPTRIWFRGIADHNKGSETLGYTEVDADLFIRTNGTCEEFITQQELDNMLNNKSKENMFKQYGFEVPDFDCTILTKVNNDYVGYVIACNDIIALSWALSGNCYIGVTYIPKYNLTPIKQPWYETCKYPVIVKTEDNNIFIIKDELQNYTEVTLKTLTPLSNEEIDQLKQDF